MTKEEFVTALIYECNQAFQRKDKNGKIQMRSDMDDMYSEFFCLASRFEKSLLQPKKKQIRAKQIVL